MHGIVAVARAIDRVPHTIRIWEYKNELPEHLRSSRNSRGHRVWTDEQVEGIKRWMAETDRRPARALEEYRASQKKRRKK